jgi:diaminopimelate decarboxylase
MTVHPLTQRLQLFPVSAQVTGSGEASRLEIAGCNLELLAEAYGTPLYIYDQATLEACLQEYHQALAGYPGTSGLTYAGKAFLCLAIAQWAAGHDLTVDCTGAGEIYIAVTAGVPRRSILVHGVNKSPEDLQAAIMHAGTIVVDNLTELQRLVALSYTSSLPELWLRLRPGLAVDTHAHTQTGQEDSKFGLGLDELEQAVTLCLQHGLPLTGIHFHQGSHFHNVAPLAPAITITLDHLVTIRKATGWYPATLCTGGGWGLPYHEDDLPHPAIGDYVGFITHSLKQGCLARGLPLPHLQLEPGRSLVARAGVALYRVGAVKQTANRRWLLLDGGMVDNPRPALYGARYSALPVSQPQRSISSNTWLGGPYCESGDILIHDLPMAVMQPGELVAIPVSGAYQLSMGSNYNGARRPAVLWLQDGETRLIQRRETLADLVDRDFPL